jgi:hypothetical protein
MSGAKHRAKGDRVEREIVKLHEEIGIHAERYPLSGASRFRGSGHDIDIYPRDRDAPLVAEVKARKDGKGFTQLEKWLGEYDVLFLRKNQSPQPMVIIPWRVWQELIGGSDAPTQRTAPDDVSAQAPPSKVGNGEISDKAAKARKPPQPPQGQASHS